MRAEAIAGRHTVAIALLRQENKMLAVAEIDGFWSRLRVADETTVYERVYLSSK